MRPMPTRRQAAALVLTAAALAAAGCGQNGAKDTGVDDSATTQSQQSQAPAEPATPKVPAALKAKPKVEVPSGAAPKKTESKDLIAGTGKAAKSGDQLSVQYVGVLYKGGKEFDSSFKAGMPFDFQLGQGMVIPGWDKGLVGAKVGTRRQLTIPAKDAYGAQGQPPDIPPNSPLVFVIDVLSAQ